jgi:DNA-binding NarL/FixJ family response regulator
MTEQPIRVLLVDDHALFRQGIASLLASQPDFLVVGEAALVRESILLADELSPDLVLMDFSLPDGNGLDATKEILARHPEIAIVILTVQENDEILLAAMRAGAKGYLLKNVRIERLLAYLRGVPRGEPAIEPEMTGRILDAFVKTAPREQETGTAPELTQREQESFDEPAAGASNGEIAERLVLSQNTAKNRLSRVLSKLGLHSLREAMDQAGKRSP